MKKPKLAKELPPGIYTGVLMGTSTNPSGSKLRIEMYIPGKGRIKQTMKLKG